MPPKLRDGTRWRFRNERIDTVQEAEHAAHAKETGELRGGLASFEALHRAQRDSGFLCERALAEIASDTVSSEPRADGAESALIGLIFNISHTPNMAH